VNQPPPCRQQHRQQHRKPPQWDVVCENLRGDPIVLRTWVGLAWSLPQVMFRVTEAGAYVVAPRVAGAQFIVNIRNAYNALAAVNHGHRIETGPWPAHCWRPDGTYVDVKTKLVRANDGPGVGVQVDREDAVAVLSYECGPRLIVALKKAYRVQAGLRAAQS
jgi:hypothetical protein